MENQKQQVNTLLTGSKNVLITMRADAGYDELATGLAWLYWLERNKKTAELIIEHHNLAQFSWLLGADKIQLAGQKERKHFVIRVDTKNFKLGELSYQVKENYLDLMLAAKEGEIQPEDIQPVKAYFPFDLVVILGASDLTALGSVHTEFHQHLPLVPIINIDRRLDNANFGQLNIINITATSLAEVCYDLWSDQIDASLAHYLLVSLIAATNSFQSPQVNPQTLNLASLLIIAGAKREDIILNLYRTKDLTTLKLWGKILSRLKQEDGIVYSFISRDELPQMTIDWLALCNELILTSPSAKIAVLLYQKEFDQTAVHVVARDNFDLTSLLSRYNPTGNRRQVEFSLTQALPNAEKEVLLVLAEKMKLIGL